MKILFGSTFLSHFGGGERLLLELVNYAASKGHEVVFAGTSSYDGPGNKSYTLPWTRSGIPPRELTEQFYNTLSGATYKEFARIAEKENPDRIFIQSEAQLFKFLPENLRKKTYFWCQEPPRFVFEPRTLPLVGRPHFHLYWLMKPVLEPVWRGLDQVGWVAGCSDYSAGRLKELFGLEAKTRYNWVDTDYFKPAQVRKSGIPTIFCATRINPIKRQLLICQALAMVKDLDWKAVLAGSVADNRYYSEIVSFCEKNGLSGRVEFPGPIGGSKLVEAYTKAAFTVYTAFYEPFGSVPVEGMACGTPAIGVNEGGVREVIADGEVGFLAEATPEGLAEKMRTLLEDENLRKEMASKGRKFVIDKFEMKARCQDFLDDFEQTTRT